MARQRRIPTPAWERDSGIGSLSKDRMKLLGAIGVTLLVVAALGIIGWGFLSDYIGDQQRPGSTAIKVNDRNYTVGDVTERVKMLVEESGGSSNQASIIIPTVTHSIIEEGLLLSFAAEKEIEATDEEVKAEIAKTLGIEADDPNFDARLQEELATIDLNEEQYRDIARGTVLKAKLTEKFKQELPAGIESVRYRVIQVEDQATADDLKAQLDGGADFGALAMENSLDTSNKDLGGDAGWAPRGFISDEQAETFLFNLDVNEIAVYPTQGAVYIYQMLEKQADRPVDDDKKDQLAADAFSEWIADKEKEADITNELDFAEGNSDKLGYIIDRAELTLGF